MAENNRRDFLRSASLAGAAALCPGVFSELPAAESKSPNEKLNIGVIGVNHRGRANTSRVQSENIAALCDVDEGYLAGAKERFPKAAAFQDWRKLCGRKDIDAVVVSTTDHTHAPASLMAMRNGKHVYCEKPLAHTVEEARLMRKTARKAKVATQMGTQIHATDNYRRVVELIAAGAIGPVREAHVWCGRTISGTDKKPPAKPPPPQLQWDLWLGPAKERPFRDGYVPGNLTWNRWWDFGNGVLGDMGSHLIDLPYWALDLKHPTSVEADGPAVNEHANPPWLVVTWRHPARGKWPAAKVVWYHSDKRPQSPPGVDLSRWHIGVMFVGDEGQLVADYSKRILLPKEKFAGYKPPQPTIPSSKGHWREWIDACKTGSSTLCDFEYSGALIEHNLLGNAAYRTGKPLTWYADQLKSDVPAAQRFIQKEYRKGWELERMG